MCNGGLLPDIMHDVSEGALLYEMKQMLKVFVYEERYFSVQDLESCLQHMELGYMEAKDRPTPIPDATLRSDNE